MEVSSIIFALVSFISVLIYLPIAGSAGWQARKVYDFETAYWKAFETFMWSLGIILFRGSPSVDIWAIIPVLPTTIIYGLISEQPDMAFDLTGNTPLTPTQIAVLSTIGAVVGLYLIVAFYLDPFKSTLLYRLIPLFLFVTWLLIWLGVNKASEKTTVDRGSTWTWNTGTKYEYKDTPVTTTAYSYGLHLHHWIIAVIGFLLCLSPDIHGQIMSGIFWGVFCQEAAAYGIMPPTNVRKTSTTETERVFTYSEQERIAAFSSL